jgi:hypothetical protein
MDNQPTSTIPRTDDDCRVFDDGQSGADNPLTVLAEVRRAIGVLFAPGSIVNLRILDTLQDH